MQYTNVYLVTTINILKELCVRNSPVESLVRELVQLRARGGRLFIIGLGGNAAHASHAAADFRNLCQIEAHSFDNIAALTASVNDCGWDTIFQHWLKASRFAGETKDLLLVLSVGGGAVDPKVSTPLICAIAYARAVGGCVAGIVGRDGGYTKQWADVCVVIPPLNLATVTPQTEGIQSVLLHLLVSHPELQRTQAKWESLAVDKTR